MESKELIFLVEESDEGGYEARSLGFSIYTQADTFDGLRESVRDAVQCHFEEDEMPKIIHSSLCLCASVVIPPVVKSCSSESPG